jgi:hypothetical protein
MVHWWLIGIVAPSVVIFATSMIVGKAIAKQITIE